ncbi:MAG: aldo/keto reductase [Anaerolineaceae bacterium]|nr:aldo/keto reductase [Anaerolineaceae bacterium]
MELRNLGRTGVKVSPLCLGAMNFGGPTAEEESIQIIQTALDGGINFIDTANVYNAGESERVVGRALKANGKRDQIVLATKVHGNTGEGPNERGNSRYHILKACEDSLSRLQTDHIDLYQLHRPVADMAQDETLRALDDLIHQGKVLYVGCSTFPAWMVMEGLAISEKMNLTRFVSEQPPYNLLDRRIENELVPLALKYNLALLPWSPLAGGILAGRYDEGEIPENSRAARAGQMFLDRLSSRGVEVARQLGQIARQKGITTAQLALLWCMVQPGVTSPITGPRTIEHIKSFLPVMEMSLSSEELHKIDELVHPGNAVADFHNSNPWMKARIS